MSDCIFCKIVNKEIPSKPVFENDYALAFNDINPQAPVHILLIPKTHYDSINEVDDVELLGKLMKVATQIAKEQELENGYRIVINKGEEGGQTVYHLHIHIIGGRSMKWPPG
ncbi:MAG: histidine triad nucleotide-binding protein [Cyanobacteriota bacterium]